MNRIFLSDNTLVKFFFHSSELETFLFHHFHKWNSRPARNDFCDVFCGNFFFENTARFLELLELYQFLLQFFLCGWNTSIADFCGFCEVCAEFCVVGFSAKGFEIFFERADFCNDIFLVLPFEFDLACLFAKVCDFLFNFFYAVFYFFVGNATFDFFCESFTFDLKTHDLAMCVFEYWRLVFKRYAECR